MKFPVISRERFEEMQARLIAIADREMARAADADRRHADLLARYHTLRLQGAVPVTPPTPKPPLDPIEQAILIRSGGDPELMAIMREQVIRDRANRMNDADILMAIHLGQRADGPVL